MLSFARPELLKVYLCSYCLVKHPSCIALVSNKPAPFQAQNLHESILPCPLLCLRILFCWALEALERRQWNSSTKHTLQIVLPYWSSESCQYCKILPFQSNSTEDEGDAAHHCSINNCYCNQAPAPAVVWWQPGGGRGTHFWGLLQGLLFEHCGSMSQHFQIQPNSMGGRHSRSRAVKLYLCIFWGHSEGTAETSLTVSIHSSILMPQLLQKTFSQGGFAALPWKDCMSNSEIINSQWQF